MRISMVLPDQYADRPDERAQRQRRREIAYRDRRECDVKIGEPGVFDESDQPDPVNILAVTKDKCVVGYACPLPAAGPAMPERPFSQLLTSGALNASEIENFRVCVDTNLPWGRAALRRATLTPFASIIEWPRANGYNQIVTAADKNFERVLREVGSWKAPLREMIIAQLCAEIMLIPDGGLFIEQLGYGVEPAGLKLRRSRAAYGQTDVSRNSRRQGAA